MYKVVIDKRSENKGYEVKKYKGDFPCTFLEKLWEETTKFVVISTYSNTVKVPYTNRYNELDFHEFPLELFQF